MSLLDKFFKKKDQKNENPKKEINEVTEVDESLIFQEIEYLKNKLQNIMRETEIAKVEEEIGLKYLSLAKNEEAVYHFEKSLSLNTKFGDSYKQLIVLYNKLMIEATRNNDDDLSRKYMEKVDEIRKIGKQLTFKK